MVKFLSLMLAVAMVFGFAGGVAMAADENIKESVEQSGKDVGTTLKDAGEGVGKGTIATGKAIGKTVVGTGTAVVGIGKAVVEGTRAVVHPVVALGKDGFTELEKGTAKKEEKK
ncbi:MAG: hypothetical protein V1882_05870 [Candidatus Omnitrophota bacterium]